MATLTFDDGSRYEGGVKDGKPHGKGKSFTSSGECIYEGSFKNGLRHGKGKKLNGWGGYYEGEFKNGEKAGGWLYTTNGEHREWVGPVVKMNYNKGRYEGMVKGGKPYGRGKFYYANGDRFEGDFKDGKPNGLGTYFYANGDNYVDNFKDGKRLMPPSKVYITSRLINEGQSRKQVCVIFWHSHLLSFYNFQPKVLRPLLLSFEYLNR